MNIPKSVSRSRHVHGASAVTALIAVVIIVAVAAAAWFLVISPHRAAIQVSQPVAKADKKVVKKAAPPPANVAAMSTSELLSEASKAIKDQRLLAPEGNNAFEFYLKVLERQPNNQVAKDALRETFPFATNAAEQVINQGKYNEAEREIGLLAKASPDNYTLTILRSKLDARRKVKVQQQQAQQLAAQQAAAAKVANAKQAILDKQQQLAAQKKAQTAAAAKAQQQKQSPEQVASQNNQQQPSQPVAPKVVIQGAVLAKKVAPRYPPAARRMRRQGWVTVQYTVGTNGQVSDAHVIASQPHHVFDREAVRAIERWVYKPALRNGKPMAVTMTKRVNFTLGGH